MKRRKLRYKKERVVLSDVLPYEVPLIFSNRHFYDFLISNKIFYKDSKVYWRALDETVEQLVRLVFGAGKGIKVHNQQIEGKTFSYFEQNGKDMPFESIPFGYNINHKENEYRELSVCHPRSQLELVDFYERFKELIIYYCNISPFSIRKPQRISKFVYFKDKTHYESLDSSEENSGVEQHDKEYESLRSFFVYKDSNNVYKFYESYKFHRCEKKYSYLMKLDISKCFDSIYTHSLSWALLGKEVVKDNLEQSKLSFSGLFDKFMMRANYNETNGIIIGPEFSRIFAELILQAIDLDLETSLREKALTHKVDYEIFRYVDDYFIFYNDDKVKGIILESLQLRLKEYKLYLNINKQVIYERPIITEITIAKNKIKSLINEGLQYKAVSENKVSEEAKDSQKGRLRIKSTQLITHYKTVLKDCNASYKDVLNYTLAIVEVKILEIFDAYSKIEKKEDGENEIIGAICNLIEFLFFIYSVAPRANASIRLCRILSHIVYFTKSLQRVVLGDIIYKVIYDNIRLTLSRNRQTDSTQVETLYLLLIIAELGSEYLLDEKALCDYFGIEKGEQGKFESNKLFNYFSITVLLFYIKGNEKYSALLEFIEVGIKKRFDQSKALIKKSTELVLLLMDTLACPYISLGTKEFLLDLYGINDKKLQENIIKSRDAWFINWSGFDLRKELEAKMSREVY